MPAINNIFNTKTSHVEDASWVQFGSIININVEDNSKEIRGSAPIVDFGINIEGGCNLFVDADLFDDLNIG